MVIGGRPVTDESEDLPEDEAVELAPDDEGDQERGNRDTRAAASLRGGGDARGNRDTR